MSKQRLKRQQHRPKLLKLFNMLNSHYYYLYCLKEKTGGRISLRGGIDNKKVYTLPYKDIEAVITEVSRKEFDPKKIKSKLEDLKWAEEKIRNHEGVIEKAMKDSPVIPLKFLTLYETKESLGNVLEKQYKEFRKLLDRLKDKAEWGLKVYVIDKERLIESLKKEDKEIVKLKAEISSKPEGVKYFLEKKMNEKILEKIDAQLDKHIKDIFEAFAPFSIENPVINKLLPAELTNKGKEMILNVSYLISKEKVGEFQKRVARLHEYYFPKGLWLEYIGPWPPYGFVKLDHGDKSKNKS